MGKSPVLLSGSAHPEFAQQIAEHLDTNLINATTGTFPDGETQIEIHDNVRKKDVFLIQPFAKPQDHHIMEAAFMVDALRRASAADITMVIPYFGYSRQDRKERPRVPISAKVVTDIFADKVDRIVSVDLHSHQQQGFSNLPHDHLYAANSIYKYLSGSIEDPVIVAPDTGAAKRVKGLAKKWDAPWAIIDKDRLGAKKTEVATIVGESVKNRNAILLDDIASTGGSLLEAAKALHQKDAKSIIAATVHPVLCSGAPKRINKSNILDMLFVTDTLPKHWKSDKIETITIVPLVAEAIHRINRGKSLGPLFK